jgi:alpha-beta hydrolase superfamily lysophospholipase
VLILSLTACGNEETPPAPAQARPMASCVDEAEQQAGGVELTRSDGETFDALVEGEGDSAIIFANQAGATICQWRPIVKQFAQEGYRTVQFEYAGPPPMEQEVHAAVAEVRERGATSVFLMGASKGGTAVLAAAATAETPVDGVVSLSAPRQYHGTSALNVMDRLTTPVLFLAGTADGDFAAAAQDLYDACAATDKEIILRTTSVHGVGLLEPDVLDTVKDFLAEHGTT